MRIYFINLDRHPERRAHMEALLQGLDVERVAATDARDWPQPPTGLTRFERACVQSHRVAWTRFLKTSEPCACFLEDDVHLAPDFAAYVNDSGGWIPPDAHAVKLDTFFNRVMLDLGASVVGDRRLARLHTRHESSAGYILTRKGAEFFLAATENPILPIDYVLFPEEPFKRGLSLYQMSPAIAIQDSLYASHYGGGENFGSSIQKVESKKKKIIHVAKRETARLFKQARRIPGRLRRKMVLGLKSEVIPFR
jgi:glycosyl transferase, family 25